MPWLADGPGSELEARHRSGATEILTRRSDASGSRRSSAARSFAPAANAGSTRENRGTSTTATTTDRPTWDRPTSDVIAGPKRTAMIASKVQGANRESGKAPCVGKIRLGRRHTHWRRAVGSSPRLPTSGDLGRSAKSGREAVTHEGEDYRVATSPYDCHWSGTA